MAMATQTSKSHSASVKRSDSFFKPRSGPQFFPAVQRKASAAPVVQQKLAVSKPADPLEKEADSTADRVLRMPADPVQGTAAEHAQRTSVEQVQKAPVEQVQRLEAGTPPATHVTEPQIRSAATGGESLGSDVRTFMEPRLGADFSSVRLHADKGAARLSSQLSARAFTYGNHVFFGRDQYQPGSDDGRRLLAHELTHTIQQGASVRRSLAVQKAEAPAITTTGSSSQVQRLGVQDALDYFADRAHNIPGFRMLTLVLGFNPVTMRGTPRTAADFLRALIEMVPGGNVITRTLDNHGVITKAAVWVEKKVAWLGDIGSPIAQTLTRFLSSLRWSDILDLGGVWDRAKTIFTGPIGRLISFGKGVVGDLLNLVKEAILRPLAALAQGTPAFDLLKAVLGRNPITGEPVPRSADVLIGGFMKMIGQEEVWLNIKRGNAIPRAFAWFQGALAGLLGFVRSIPVAVVRTLRSLTFVDVLTVVGAFRKISSAFLSVAGRFSSWAFRQVIKLLEILFSVVAPGVLPYITKAKGAFQTILRNPVGFVRNLVAAGKLGFQRFAGNILAHLKTALVKWLVGPLADAGVYIPTSFALLEVVKLVLSVLGLTWQNIRSKLVRIIPEPVLTALEKTASILVTLVRDGPAAAWEQIKAELTELKDTLIGQITTMIQTEVVKAAVTKLVSMLNPAGAVIQAIIAIYRTITFFIQRAQQIGAVVASFINSIAAIAAGQVTGAAQRVEATLARSLVVVLGFLANFAGLGGIPAKLVAVVQKVRAPVDKALDKIVDWLGRMLQKLVGAAKAAAKKLFEWWKKRVPITGGDEPHTLTFQGDDKSAKLVVRSQPEQPSAFLRREHKASKQDEDALAKPLKSTQAGEVKIADYQNELKGIDDNELAAVGGKKRTRAEVVIQSLDKTLRRLSATIGGALAAWGRDGALPDVDKIVIERAPGFTARQKANIARGYAEMKVRLAGKPYASTEYLVKNSRGKLVNVPKDVIDRRHVVSSDDMAKHYRKVLAKKRLSQAKIMVEQRGSVTEARQPVKGDKLTSASVIAAAKTRYRRFFGWAQNIFLGSAPENRSFQEALDTGHPEMAGEKLRDHIKRIKRAWALDSSFEPTEH